MSVEQRDVYLFPPTHNPALEEHPYIVLSVKDANDYENSFVGVMITSSEAWRDEHSFELTDAMFERPLGKPNSHARMHLVTLCLSRQIKGQRLNRMKPYYFKQLMRSIGELVFSYSFEPLEEGR